MKKLFILIFYYILFSNNSFGQYPTHIVDATESYNGQFGHCVLRIQYVIPGSMRKPLLVVEGFDPGYIVKPEEAYGLTTLNSFILDIQNSGSAALQNLLTGGAPQYDIVYVEWSNGTDYLQRNALVVEEAIRWINAQKGLAGSNEPNVVLGQSMGGVVARYALRDMENKGQNHQTRLFISDDAPQQGANVPQGYQHLARHARDLYVKTGVGAIAAEVIQVIRNGASPLQALSLANQPAAKQILLNYVNDNNTVDNTVHDQWQTDLRNMGYPQGVAGVPFRKVVISNGSECAATEPFSAGDNLLTYQGRGRTSFLSDLGLSGIVLSTAAGLLNQPAFALGTLPGRNDFNFDFAVNSKATGSGNQVYKGKITYTKKLLWLIPITVVITNRSYNASAATLPYDYYPGGLYDIRSSGYDVQSSTFTSIWGSNNITVSRQPTFAFVPVTSALDIGGGSVSLANSDYLTKYIGSTPPIAPKNTPFQNFITAENSGSTNNEAHISFRQRNADWLAAELNSTNPVSNCSFICNSTNMTVTGPTTICTNPEIYTLNNVPAGTTISWQANPNIVTMAPAGNQVTVTRNGTGNFVLTANVFSATCGGVNINSATLRAGGFGSGDYPVSGPSSVTCNQFVTFSTVVLPGATNYAWFYPGNWTYQGGQGTNTITLLTHSPNGNYQVGVRVANICDAGGSPGIKFGSINGCSNFFKVSPNPGNSSITVAPDPALASAASTQNAGASSAAAGVIYQIKITDLQGNIKKTFSYPKGISSVKLNVSDLINGVYTIQIFNKAEWESQQLIINR